MKITKLKNTLAKTKKSSITFYADCCCCCCCCILLPLGNLSAEAIVKKVYKHDGRVKRHFGWNFLFCILSIGVGALMFFFLEEGIGSCKDSLCNLKSMKLEGGSDVIIIIGSALIVYFLFLFKFSKKWLMDVNMNQRIRAVIFQFILSIIFIVIFSALSVFGMLGVWGIGNFF